MRFSPVLAGKIVGAVAALIIVVFLLLWAHAEYTLKGTIVVDTGAYLAAARNISVDLLHSGVEEELLQLRAEYDRQLSNAYNNALASLRHMAHTATPVRVEADETGPLSIDSLVRGEAQRVRDEVQRERERAEQRADALLSSLAPLSEEETAEVRARTALYRDHALYLRDVAAEPITGTDFYERGAQFWEQKATRLSEKGRVIVDDASLNFVIRERPGGLGREPIQRVSTVKRTDVDIDALFEDESEEKPAVDQEKKDEETPHPATVTLIPGLTLTSNDLMNASAEIIRLQQRAASQLRANAERLYLEMSLDHTRTDEDGAFIFKGPMVQPGRYFLKSRYGTLSADGELIEYAWFVPVTISLRRLAINKETEVHLDNTNHGPPPGLDIYPLHHDALFARIVADLTRHAESSDEAQNIPSPPQEN